MAQGNYTFNAKKPPELLKSFFLKLSPIFVFKHEKEKHCKKFPVRNSETGGGLKINPLYIEGLNE